MAQSKNPHLTAAKRKFAHLKAKHPDEFEEGMPYLESWKRALEIDPKGRTALSAITDIEEQLTPMAF